MKKEEPQQLPANEAMATAKNILAKDTGIAIVDIEKRRFEMLYLAAYYLRAGDTTQTRTAMKDFVDPFDLEDISAQIAKIRGLKGVTVREETELLSRYAESSAESAEKPKAKPADIQEGESLVGYEFRKLFLELNYFDIDAIKALFSIPDIEKTLVEEILKPIYNRFQLVSLICLAIFLDSATPTKMTKDLLNELGKAPINEKFRQKHSPNSIEYALSALLDSLETMDLSAITALDQEGAAPIYILQKINYLLGNIGNPGFGSFQSIHEISKKERNPDIEKLMATLTTFLTRPLKNLSFVNTLIDEIIIQPKS